MFKIPPKPPNLPKYPYDIQNAIENFKTTKIFLKCLNWPKYPSKTPK